MVFSWDRFVAVWGEENIVRQDVAGMPSMPDELQYVLSEIGLPRELKYYFEPIPPRYVLAPVPGWIIGTDYGTYLVVRDDSGEVWSVPIEPDEYFHEQLVNSDVWKFIDCLTEYAAFLWVLRKDEMDEAEVAPMSKCLQSLDRRIFDDPEYWWASIFEQLEQGLL